MKAKNQAELGDQDYYLSPEGYVIFTERYLLRRGYCCQNGCRHCPYGFDPKTGNFRKDDKRNISTSDQDGNSIKASQAEATRSKP